MSELTFPFWAVFQVLENRLSLAEALGFPEVSRLGAGRDRLLHVLRENVRRLLEADALPRLHRRQRTTAPTAVQFVVRVEPEPRASGWREPLALRFDGLRWSHGKDAVIVFIPTLGIEVLAARSDDLNTLVESEIRSALTRGQALILPRLVMLQRVTHIDLKQDFAQVKLQSPKARVLAAELGEENKPSILRQIGTDLRKEPPEPYLAYGNVFALLGEMLGSAPPRSVLLVGPAGVGKTAAVRELVRRRGDYQLKKTPFWATSGARLVAGMSGYGMWQERCQQLVREASRRRAILHLGNLVELMNVGKSEHNTLGVASFLRPYLARGEMVAIAECTPEQLPVLEREDPHLLDVFQRLALPEPDVEHGREILQHCALHARTDVRQSLPDETLDTLDRLHRRFATYSAYPGRPLRFLRNLLHDHPSAANIAPADIIRAFTRETGLPQVLLDPEQQLDLADTRQWFEQRVVGQPEAVDLIVDLLATTKAGLTRPGKPIAGLLFIGPTGVGKTEMAKALAEFLFGSRLRITRLDMSEFSDTAAVQRLVGFSSDEGLLTAKVREQPFTVLLLDEFEKAHPLFLDLLLQILGDGRLTDAGGRLANFCNTVVILTSNLGSESYQQGALGFSGASDRQHAQAERDSARAHFEREVREHVRPELFNRIDRLVPFAPLGTAEIAGIARRHLQRLQSRDGIRSRGVSLRIDDNATAHLARNGFDSRYGARPLLRTVERELLSPLADQVNRYSGGQALEVDVELGADGLQIRMKPCADAGNREFAGSDSATPLSIAEQCVQFRR
ncbi:MAG TPA: AAA family ATPase, partial [Gemmataceae bacterium]|nr:AAA family ATPase [Gemmataceae bacterium]